MYQKNVRLSISNFLEIIINYKKEPKAIKEAGANKYDWKAAERMKNISYNITDIT